MRGWSLMARSGASTVLSALWVSPPETAFIYPEEKVPALFREPPHKNNRKAHRFGDSGGNGSTPEKKARG
jgi:hypothetical protein